ncbi:MAG TPA: tryptophan--tRNA ligase [Pyrinomonadaceae bacterium]|nr:tryptophan--tRNA ligase [Pyrinomonadaceae bacterium]
MPSRVLSGIQPTAEMHIGNYFGAVRNWVALQHTHECIYCVVDLHAITMPYEPARLRANTDRMIIDLLACGIDPDKAILFIQSLVPEHAELCWVLSCLTPFGDLRRMTQFKDKSEVLESQDSTQFVSAALFSYPVLQAADILVYRAQFVPVGKDQEQHLELSRELARRFNNQFGVEIFPEPAPLFTETPKVMSLADPTKKMSKSLGERHHIRLFEDEQSIRNKIKSAVTDSGETPEGEMSPGVANLFELLKASGKTEEASALLKDYHAGTLQYRVLKETVADSIVELTSNLKTRRQDIAADSETVTAQVHEMSERARVIAGETMKEVRRIIGLPPK